MAYNLTDDPLYKEQYATGQRLLRPGALSAEPDVHRNAVSSPPFPAEEG